MQSGGVSSLIFLVVIGVWAAYFIQYWVRRRDHLATARSVDQFSESMRVLERRRALPEAGLTTQQPSDAGPARTSGPQLLLKRPVARTVTTSVAGTAPEASQGSERSQGSGRSRSSGRPGGRPRRTARATARRNRALLMLGALSTWFVAVPLVVLGMLGPAYLAVPVLSLAVALVWSRHDLRRTAARPAVSRTRPATPRSSVHDTPTTATAPQRVVHARLEPTASASSSAPSGAAADAQRAEQSAEQREEPAEAVPAAAARRVRGELYDLAAVEAANTPAAPLVPAQPARPLVDEDDIPLTWDPVPVPRPTYTMKARATRPAPAAADLVGDADTEYAAREEDLPVRQVAGA